MRYPIRILTVSLLALSPAIVIGQTPPVPDSQAGQQTEGGHEISTAALLAPGTPINASLDRSVDSKKVKSGEAVTAITTEAVRQDGRVILPKGTKLTGRVTKASARSKGDNDSTLALQFDRAQLKGGQPMPVQLSLQALAAPPETAPIGAGDLQGAGPGGQQQNPNMGNRNGGMQGNPGNPNGANSGAASTVPRTTQEAAAGVDSNGSATNTAQGTAQGAGAVGVIAPTARGVVGISGLTLESNPANSAEGAVITSTGKSVRLDGGTRLLLVSQGTSASAL
jgi:hypothetical protein